MTCKIQPIFEGQEFLPKNAKELITNCDKLFCIKYLDKNLRLF